MNKIKSLIKNVYQILIWKLQGIHVGGMNLSYPIDKKRQQILSVLKNQKPISQIFIESGTYMGDTIDFFKNNFSKIFSIELDTVLYNKALDRFKNQTNIKILQGDSGKIIKDIIGNINEPIIFWLDGHYSGGSTAKAEFNTPIFKELEAIINHPIKNHLILIDDARLFVGKEDYPTIKQVQKFFKNKDSRYSLTINNDIIEIRYI